MFPFHYSAFPAETRQPSPPGAARQSLTLRYSRKGRKSHAAVLKILRRYADLDALQPLRRPYLSRPCPPPNPRQTPSGRGCATGSIGAGSGYSCCRAGIRCALQPRSRRSAAGSKLRIVSIPRQVPEALHCFFELHAARARSTASLDRPDMFAGSRSRAPDSAGAAPSGVGCVQGTARCRIPELGLREPEGSSSRTCADADPS